MAERSRIFLIELVILWMSPLGNESMVGLHQIGREMHRDMAVKYEYDFQLRSEIVGNEPVFSGVLWQDTKRPV